MPKTIDFPDISKRLKEQQGILEGRLAREQESIHKNNVLNPDQDDRAMQSRNKARDTLLLHRTKLQLSEIELTLKRLEEGTYGICSACGGDIQPDRLNIVPTAALCIQCQQIEDRK